MFGRVSDQHRSSIRARCGCPAPVGSRDVATDTCITGIDDHSRAVYSEILVDERKNIAAGFWTWANAFFDQLGVTFEAVMTDNGARYRSNAFNDAG